MNVLLHKCVVPCKKHLRHNRFAHIYAFAQCERRIALKKCAFVKLLILFFDLKNCTKNNRIFCKYFQNKGNVGKVNI